MKTLELAMGDLPAQSAEAARKYIVERVRPGGFLLALFSNQLVEAYLRADELNLAAMPAWVKFLTNEAPFTCWGSPQKVQDWLSLKA